MNGKELEHEMVESGRKISHVPIFGEMPPLLERTCRRKAGVLKTNLRKKKGGNLHCHTYGK